MVSVFAEALQRVVNRYRGQLTAAEVIGTLEIVKIGVYHSTDPTDEDDE